MKARFLVLMLLLTCGLWAQSVVAQTPGAGDEAQRFDREKLLEYAGCAASIAVASTTQQWWVAGLGCLKVINQYWDA